MLELKAVADPGGGGFRGFKPPQGFFFACQYMKIPVDHRMEPRREGNFLNLGNISSTFKFNRVLNGVNAPGGNPTSKFHVCAHLQYCGWLKCAFLPIFGTQNLSIISVFSLCLCWKLE